PDRYRRLNHRRERKADHFAAILICTRKTPKCDEFSVHRKALRLRPPCIDDDHHRHREGARCCKHSG
ncbi:hypothetical protein, partial [Kitasatospora nipponensis]|uniref:hypothetical protein n=1 Tax=Kitasatospora nipponensis TaxID=258049 RepID=UPI0031D4D84B